MAQNQQPKADFDLYAPSWILVTLVVETSIIGFFNAHISAFMANEALGGTFSVSRITSLFSFLLFFFTMPPLAVYLFARLKLLDDSTRFLRLFSALGYSYVSYIPSIALTIVGINFIHWVLILAALAN